MPNFPAIRAKEGKKAAGLVEERIIELDPATRSEVTHFDVEKAFETYCAFGGDVIRTAAAMKLDVLDIVRACDENHWATRLRHVFELKKAGKPGEIERVISRTMNFVQAHRLRVILDRVLAHYHSMSDEELVEACYEPKTDKEGAVIGKKANVKPFTDLAAALEKCHMMLYYALSDSMPERAKRKENPDDDVPLAEIHSVIARQMSERGQQSPREQLIDAQAKQVGIDPQELADAAAAKTP